jgi:hypothetical protein
VTFAFFGHRAALRKRDHRMANKQSQASIFDGSNEQLIDAVQTCAFFGNRSAMWLTRRKAERAKEITSGGVPFPLGRFIGTESTSRSASCVTIATRARMFA